MGGVDGISGELDVGAMEKLGQDNFLVFDFK